MIIQIGRLFLSHHRTRGAGLSFTKNFKTEEPMIQLWIGRRLFGASWCHRENCECDYCNGNRYLYGD